MPPHRHVLIEERTTSADAGVGEQQVNRAAFRSSQQFIDAVDRGKIGLDRGDLRAMPLEIGGDASISGSSATTRMS